MYKNYHWIIVPFDVNAPCTVTSWLKVAVYVDKWDKDAFSNDKLPVTSTFPLKYAVFDGIDGIFESSER